MKNLKNTLITRCPLSASIYNKQKSHSFCQSATKEGLTLMGNWSRNIIIVRKRNVLSYRIFGTENTKVPS